MTDDLVTITSPADRGGLADIAFAARADADGHSAFDSAERRFPTDTYGFASRTDRDVVAKAHPQTCDDPRTGHDDRRAIQNAAAKRQRQRY